MSIFYTMSLWNLDIIFSNNLWTFDCENLKTNKNYEQSFSIIELMNMNKILNVYPKMFEKLISNEKPKVNFNENNAIIVWTIIIPLIGTEIIELHIREKVPSVHNVKIERLKNRLTLLEEENVELKQLNEMLQNKISLLEEEINEFKNEPDYNLTKNTNIEISYVS